MFFAILYSMLIIASILVGVYTPYKMAVVIILFIFTVILAITGFEIHEFGENHDWFTFIHKKKK